MAKVKKSEKMKKMAQEVIREHAGELGWIAESNLKIEYVVSNSEKKNEGRSVNGECRKTDDTVKAITGIDYIITFYAPNIMHFTPEQERILMYHELLHINVKAGKRLIRPHDYVVNDFKTVVENYGAGWSNTID